ncbi:MAG: DNA methylase, partial [Acutalibacteraceae bacterium]
SLKAYKIPGRARLFEVIRRVREINSERRYSAPGQIFNGSSYDSDELKKSGSLELTYIIAKPRMALYMEYSARIYNIYLKYVAPEDIHVYSIDEVFIDATDYLDIYKVTAREFADKIIGDVFSETSITATAGIGTNLYLCKVAMDIVAKHIEPDKNGVRIAELNETSYRRLLWNHRPIADFWRVGRGYAKKLEEHGIFTMGDIAKCSLGKPEDYYNEELLYGMFGINAELLIDHAWGYESCSIKDIKAYKPESNSLGSGQVLKCPYEFEKAGLVLKEMTDLLVLELVEKGLMTDQIVITVGYDAENLNIKRDGNRYRGPVTTDFYGRGIPKSAHGSVNLENYTSSTKIITDAVMKLYNQIVDSSLFIRRINITANHVVSENSVVNQNKYAQLNLFTDFGENRIDTNNENDMLQREKKMQKTVIGIKKKYGKNAIIKGMNLEYGATAIQRNDQIGGHKA